MKNADSGNSKLQEITKLAITQASSKEVLRQFEDRLFAALTERTIGLLNPKLLDSQMDEHLYYNNSSSTASPPPNRLTRNLPG
jgi:hypothetical protein